MSGTNNKLLETIANAYQGATKRASIGDNADDGLQSPSEGSRSKENSKDVSAQKPLSVQGAADGPSIGGLDSPINDIGPKKGETGTNVPSTKSTKDDPGTSHPAKAASASDILKIASQGDGLMASIAMYANELNKQASAAGTSTPATPTQTKTASENPAVTEARVNGYLTGAALASVVTQGNSYEKAAAEFVQQNAAALSGVPAQAQPSNFDRVFQQEITAIAEKAANDANAVADYIHACNRTAKAAEGLPPEDPMAAGAGGMPPGGDPMAAMGGGGGGDPAAAMGGGDPMAAMGGGGAPPMGGDPAAGGMPPGGAPGGAAGGGQVDPAAMEVAQALMSGELTLEELAQALTQGGDPAAAAASGGDPAAAGGGAPPAPPAAADAGGPPADSGAKGKESDKEAAEKRAAARAGIVNLINTAVERFKK